MPEKIPAGVYKIVEDILDKHGFKKRAYQEKDPKTGRWIRERKRYHSWALKIMKGELDNEEREPGKLKESEE